MPVPVSPQCSANVDTLQQQLGVTADDIQQCSFSAWYDKFASVTFKSKIVRLPNDFIQYLNADGIYLPQDGQPQAAATIEELDAFDEEEGDQDQETDAEQNVPDFPDIERVIRQTVDEFGGAIFPKLNWSSPRDAAWITATQSLKCTSPFDVYLLLKSSDFINHDLNHAFDHCQSEDQLNTSFDLILRKWHNLQPSMEFRCFVKNKELIGICQRDLTFYSFLFDVRQELETKIYEFFEDHIRDGFPSTNYVFDVYIQQDRRKVWLVDFNPFTFTTDSLLYDWDELISFDVDHQEPDFRLIQSTAEANAIACNAPRFASNMLPKDVIDLSDGKSIAEFAEEFERAMALSEARQGDDNSDSDSD